MHRAFKNYFLLFLVIATLTVQAQEQPQVSSDKNIIIKKGASILGGLGLAYMGKKIFNIAQQAQAQAEPESVWTHNPSLTYQAKPLLYFAGGICLLYGTTLALLNTMELYKCLRQSKS